MHKVLSVLIGVVAVYFVLGPVSVFAAEETVRIYAHESDASIQTTPYPGSWSDQYDATYGGNLSTGLDRSVAYFGVYNSDTGYQGTHRSFLSFDLSVLPQGVVIKSANVNLTLARVHRDFLDENSYVGILEGRQESALSITEDDIEMCGDKLEKPTELSERKPVQDLIPNENTKFNLNVDGLHLINFKKDGFVKLCVREGHDIQNTPLIHSGNIWKGVGIDHYTTEYPGTEYDPYLEITYTVPDTEDETIDGLITSLIQAIKAQQFAKPVESSYLAHLEKLIEMIENAEQTAVINQLEQFIKKVTQDRDAGNLSAVVANDLITQAQKIIDLLSEYEFEVPLMTQVESEYPSLTETADWADDVFADGRADVEGDCGRTIEQCGCSITSLSMLGRYYGITEGIDGTNVDPGHMNAWLLDNGGYTADGSVLWSYALAYMGEKKDDKFMSTLSHTTHNEKDATKIAAFVRDAQPVVAFNAAKGHWFILRGTTGKGYYVNDPFWYNTKTTHDTKDALTHVQGYNDSVTKANLFSHSDELKVLDEVVEVVLESPAELLITDSRGRRVGYNPDTAMVVNEISGGSYDQEDFVKSSDEVTGSEHKAKRLMVVRPQSNTFTLSVIGTGEGAYNLTTAVSDGKGSLQSAREEGEAEVGKVDTYTIVTDTSAAELPQYLADLLLLIPASDHKKFERAFKVVFLQTEKNHVAVTKTLIENLIRYIKAKYSDEEWADAVVEKLEVLVS